MELTVSERIVVQSLLPTEANFLTIRLINEAKNELSFDEDEHKRLNFKNTNDRITWDDDSLVKNFEFGATVTGLVVRKLKELDEQNKLTEDHISVYEKFIN